MSEGNANRWKGFVLGMAGAGAGLLAMRCYWNLVAACATDGASEESGQEAQDAGDGSGAGEGSAEAGEEESSGALDDVSAVGEQAREQESATAAVGRIVHQTLTGREPGSELKEALSYWVHWEYGVTMGGLYGAARPYPRGSAVRGGTIYGTLLWLLGDELIVPLLGLSEGPTAHSKEEHLQSWGAHVAYGIGTAAATKALLRIF